MTLELDPFASKPGCIAPDLGLALSQRLGTSVPLPPALDEHLRRCPACQLERLEYASLDFTAAPSPGLVAALRRALDEERSR